MNEIFCVLPYLVTVIYTSLGENVGPVVKDHDRVRFNGILENYQVIDFVHILIRIFGASQPFLSDSRVTSVLI